MKLTAEIGRQNSEAMFETTESGRQEPVVPLMSRMPRNIETNALNTYGVPIEKAGGGVYSVSFWGPGGRFKPGTWRPNTTLAGDPHYGMVDENTIDMGSRRYYRCR